MYCAVTDAVPVFCLKCMHTCGHTGDICFGSLSPIESLSAGKLTSKLIPGLRTVYISPSVEPMCRRTAPSRRLSIATLAPTGNFLYKRCRNTLFRTRSVILHTCNIQKYVMGILHWKQQESCDKKIY